MEIHTKIVGSTFCNSQRLIARLKSGDELKLKRNPQNKFDKNAIEVKDSKNRMLGHIPREIAAVFAPLMDSGKASDYKCIVNYVSGGGGFNYGCKLIISSEAILRDGIEE